MTVDTRRVVSGGQAGLHASRRPSVPGWEIPEGSAPAGETAYMTNLEVRKCCLVAFSPALIAHCVCFVRPSTLAVPDAASPLGRSAAVGPSQKVFRGDILRRGTFEPSNYRSGLTTAVRGVLLADAVGHGIHASPTIDAPHPAAKRFGPRPWQTLPAHAVAGC
jgi:hypothetical protein